MSYDNDTIQDAVQTAVRNGVHAYDPTRLVTKAVVIYESILEDGTKTLSVVPSEDMRTYEVLGFVDYAQQSARSWIDDEVRQ